VFVTLVHLQTSPLSAGKGSIKHERLSPVMATAVTCFTSYTLILVTMIKKIIVQALGHLAEAFKVDTKKRYF
jgi:hypothetical protein